MPSTTVDSPVFATICTLLEEVTGEDLELLGGVDLETSFHDDLELESIELVALSEQLLVTYGDAVDFVGWLADMELDQIIGLTIGDLVTFVTASLAIRAG